MNETYRKLPKLPPILPESSGRRELELWHHAVARARAAHQQYKCKKCGYTHNIDSSD